MQYRGYQQKAIDSAMEYIWGKDKSPQIIILPTAGGKSWVIAGICKEYGGRVLVIQANQELLAQNYDKFHQIGGIASVYSASMNSKEVSKVTYGTLQSLIAHPELFQDIKLVLIDEAHAGYDPEPGSTFSKFMAILKPEKVIGFTATPFRLKRNSMGSRLVMLNRMRPYYFKGILHVTQISELLADGYWSESRDEIWEFDSAGLSYNSTGAEFTEASIRRVMESNGVNNNIYLRLKENDIPDYKSVLVFVDSVPTAEKFAELFPESAVVSSKTPSKERKRIIAAFKSGGIKTIFNHGILTTGFDHPELDCIILGYPTNSLSLFYQIYGRGTRVHPSKEYFRFIDCCGNFERLGHPRDLVIEDIPNYGWAVTCQGNLITTKILGDPTPIKVDDVQEKAKNQKVPDKIPFGKYKDKSIQYIVKTDRRYIEWLCTQGFVKPALKKQLQLALL